MSQLSSGPMQDGPVFVLGPLRSSSMLLALSMSMHPRFQLAGDTSFLRRLVIGLRQAYDASLEPRDTSHMISRGVEFEDFFAAFGEATAGLLAPRPSLAPGADSNRLRWIDATHDNATIVLPLTRLFPEARFILVTRTVTELVAELMNHEKRTAYRTRAEVCDIPWAVQHWVKHTEGMLRAERALGSHLVMRISRDAFVADFAGTVERALHFVGEEMHPSCLVPIRGMADEVTPSLSMDLEYILSEIDDPALADRVRQLNADVLTPMEVEPFGDLATEIELETEFTEIARRDLAMQQPTSPIGLPHDVGGGVSGFVRRFRDEFSREYKRVLAVRRESRV